MPERGPYYGAVVVQLVILLLVVLAG